MTFLPTDLLTLTYSHTKKELRIVDTLYDIRYHFTGDYENRNEQLK
jgi:hypothetical protein